jgi:hypothetical protein
MPEECVKSREFSALVGNRARFSSARVCEKARTGVDAQIFRGGGKSDGSACSRARDTPHTA